MRIVATKRHASEELKEKLGIDFLRSLKELDYTLTESDFLVINVVLHLKQEESWGKREFGVMKKKVLLVNISRDQVIDEGALILASEKGKISRALLSRLFQYDQILEVSFFHSFIAISRIYCYFTIETCMLSSGC